MYMEDLDLCYRARRAGWLTWYEPAAVAGHLKGGSSGPARSLRLDLGLPPGHVALLPQALRGRAAQGR